MKMNAKEFDLKQTVSPNKFISFWRMMTGFRLPYFVATLAIGLAAVTQTGIYYLIRYFVDNVFNKPGTTAVWVVFGLIALALAQGAFTFLSGRLAAFTAEGVTRRLRDYLYDHIQRLSFTYHDNMQTGELLQRATSDVDALRRFFAEQAIGIGRITLLFLVNFAALLVLNWRLAWYSVFVIPVVVATSIVFFMKLEQRFEAYQDQEAKLSNRLQENLTGVRVVKAFARQAYERDRFEVENKEKYVRGTKLLLMHALYWPITDIICGVQMLTGFFIGANMAINGAITSGTYLAYIGLVVQIIFPIRNLGRLIAQMSTGLVSLERVNEIIRQDREPLDTGTYTPQGNLRGEVTFQQAHFAYDAELPVLHDITFTAQPGQVVALMGATGSGKTSLVNLLPRFYEYTSGSIQLDGVELREYPRWYLRQQIGIVQQEPFLFSRNIRDNITYGVGRAVTDAEVEAAARAAAVHEVILSFPEGYNTIVGERGVTLSGGQKQRVTLARTLLKNPRILIMDDATSSVDTETEASIRQALQGLMQDRTTFIIAHRIQSVMDADLILVLDHGKVVQSGTHAELINQTGIYRQVYELQVRIEQELEKDLAQTAQIAQPLADAPKSNGRSAKPLNGRSLELTELVMGD